MLFLGPGQLICEGVTTHEVKFKSNVLEVRFSLFF